jgi:hypothetical protein
MSGLPNPVGVKDLKQYLRDFAWTREAIGELEQSIAEQQKSLDLRRTELRGLSAVIEGKLSEMDVASPGNAGWKARNFELLLLLAKML